jgi:hypothetical protein
MPPAITAGIISGSGIACAATLQQYAKIVGLIKIGTGAGNPA